MRIHPTLLPLLFLALITPGVSSAAAPTCDIPIDFSQAANMGFADEVADDNRGGWTDQGPDNDFRSFPTGMQQYGGIDFKISNAEKSCIVLSGNEKPDFPRRAEIVFPTPVPARYLYCLQAVAWEPEQAVEVGQIICEYAGQNNVAEAESRFRVITGDNIGNFWMPRPLSNARVAWKHHNASSDVGIYLSCFELTGAPVSRIRFEGNARVVWMIAAATFSNRRSDAAKDTRSVMQADNEDYFTVATPGPVKPGSILDFSGLQDAPAGKYGFVQVADGQFCFQDVPGKPVRFYGSNLAYSACFIDPETVEQTAEEYAAVGYNLVRLHHIDGILADKNRDVQDPLDAGQLRNMDALIAAFRKRGIYITIDLYSTRNLAPGRVAEFPDRRISGAEYKALAFINEDVMRDWEEYARKLLTHKNEFTDLALKDDPALFSICLLNEDAIVACSSSIPWIHEIYRKRFAEWLKTNPQYSEMLDNNALWLKFLEEIYMRGYHRMETFLRNLGVKTLITDQNFWLNPATTVLRNTYDFVDNHFYWGHPVWLEQSWLLPASVMMESSISRYAGGLNRMFSNRIYGKPFCLTEWDYVSPNVTGSEGAFLVGAYASLQDWNALCSFLYSDSAKRIRREDTRAVFFNIAANPVKMLAERAGVLAFLRQDVSPARIQFPFLLNSNFFTDAASIDAYPTVLERLGLIGGTGTLLTTPQDRITTPAGTRLVLGNHPGWQPSMFTTGYLDLNGKAVTAVMDEMVHEKFLTVQEYDAKREIFRSTTGELTLDVTEGTFISTTPRSEAMVLPEGKSGRGKILAVSNQKGFASFLAAAMDEKPLAQSDRIMILHLTHLFNSGQAFRNQERTIMTEWGNTPLILFRGRAEIKLNGHFDRHELYAVDFDGSRIAPVPAIRQNGQLKFTADTWFQEKLIAVYELVKPEEI